MSDEQETYAASERHAQIMREGARFFNTIGIGCLAVLVGVIGFLIFFFMEAK